MRESIPTFLLNLKSARDGPIDPSAGLHRTEACGAQCALSPDTGLTLAHGASNPIVRAIIREHPVLSAQVEVFVASVLSTCAKDHSVINCEV